MRQEPQETSTEEPQAMANLIERADMLDVYRGDLEKMEDAVRQKRSEWENLTVKAQAVTELRDECRDHLNVLFGKAEALKELIAYHENAHEQKEPTPEG